MELINLPNYQTLRGVKSQWGNTNLHLVTRFIDNYLCSVRWNRKLALCSRSQVFNPRPVSAIKCLVASPIEEFVHGSPPTAIITCGGGGGHVGLHLQLISVYPCSIFVCFKIVELTFLFWSMMIFLLINIYTTLFDNL